MADATDPTPDVDGSAPTVADVQDLSYEQARDELVRIVARIESGEAPLEESMKLWERGEALATHCQAKLDQAQTRLDTATGAAEPVDDAGGTQAGADAGTQEPVAQVDDAEDPDDQGDESTGTSPA